MRKGELPGGDSPFCCVCGVQNVGIRNDSRMVSERRLAARSAFRRLDVYRKGDWGSIRGVGDCWLGSAQPANCSEGPDLGWSTWMAALLPEKRIRRLRRLPDTQNVDDQALDPVFWEFSQGRAAQKRRFLGEFFPAQSVGTLPKQAGARFGERVFGTATEHLTLFPAMVGLLSN